MKSLRGRIVRTDGSTFAGEVRLADGRITAVEALDDSRACDDWILPGFIDLQVNGADGIDVMDATPPALAALSAHLARTGTTAWLPTAITSPIDRIAAVDSAVADAMVEQAGYLDGPIIGLHLEGPFISPNRRGAHPRCCLEPRGEALERVLAMRAPRLVTLAPELPGALEAIKRLRAHGIAVSIGHTDSTLDQARAAVAAGARMFTHVPNAMAPMHHRNAGAALAALIPSPAFAALIADGVHVHPQFIRMMMRARGASGICLTSDRVAITAAGTDRPLSGVLESDGAARLPDGTLAGSVTTMLDAMRLMVERAGATVGEAAMMAAANPAAVLELHDRGRVETGARADLLLLGSALELKAVFIGGRELS